MFEQSEYRRNEIMQVPLCLPFGIRLVVLNKSLGDRITRQPLHISLVMNSCIVKANQFFGKIITVIPLSPKFVLNIIFKTISMTTRKPS